LREGEETLNSDIKVLDLIDVYLKRWWLVLIFALIGGLCSYFYTVTYVDPTYVSRGSLYVSAKGSNVIMQDTNPNDLVAAARLAETFQYILKSDRFMSIVKTNSNTSRDISSLKSMIKVEAIQDSEVLEITTTANSPGSAQRITQTFLDNAKDEILRVVESGSVKIVDDASYPFSPSSPNTRMNTIIGFIIGFVLICLLILIFELMDMTVKSADDVSNSYGIPVIGSIPNLDVLRSHAYYYYAKSEENEIVQ
jgi:capsular polysaccharide biosynthesis protein